jgi:hypothetical protein
VQAAPLQPTSPTPVRWLDIVAKQVSDLRFGVVQITVHDGQIVQVERTERIRLTSGSLFAQEDKQIPAHQKPGGNATDQPTHRTTGGTLR